MINANQAREQTLQLIEADDRKQITYISEEIQKAITKKQWYITATVSAGNLKVLRQKEYTVTNCTERDGTCDMYKISWEPPNFDEE